MKRKRKSLSLNENIPYEIPIFVCSTYEDLKEYRKAVENILVGMDFIIRGMEFFGSRPGNPKQECLKAVRECRAFIGIFGMRYGSIDPETGKSMAHLEYEEAMKLNLPSLIYLIDEEKQPILPKFVDKGEKADKLKLLKNRLKENHTIAFFTTPDNLAGRIAQDIKRVTSKIKKESEKGLEVFKGAYQDWKEYNLLAGADRNRFILDNLKKISPNDDELEFIIRSVNTEFWDTSKQFLKIKKKKAIVSISSKILENSAENYFLRLNTLRLLVKIAPVDAKGILWRVYNDPKNWDIKNEVILTLGKCDPDNAIIEAERVLLSEQDFKMREKAAHVFNFVDIEKIPIKPLEIGLFDKRREVRSRCAIGLARIGDPSSGPLLLKALKKEKSIKAARKIIMALAVFKDDPKVIKFAEKYDFPKWWWKSNPDNIYRDIE